MLYPAELRDLFAVAKISYFINKTTFFSLKISFVLKKEKLPEGSF
jgi:hypothetical protein